MYSKVKLAGHPIHPMLIAFPVAFYTASVIALAVFSLRGDAFWFRVGAVAATAGVIGAVLAAIPGFIDWAMGIPRGTPAKATGLAHMLCNVGALACFAAVSIASLRQFDSASPSLGPALALGAIGLVLTIVAGFLGWKLVQKHHVGVDLTKEQERLEPRPTGTPTEVEQPMGGSVIRH